MCYSHLGPVSREWLSTEVLNKGNTVQIWMLGEGKGSNQDLEIWEGKSPPLHCKNWFDSQLSCRVLPKARAAPQQQDNPLCPRGYVLPEGFPGAIGCHSALSFGGVEQTKTSQTWACFAASVFGCACCVLALQPSCYSEHLRVAALPANVLNQLCDTQLEVNM